MYTIKKYRGRIQLTGDITEIDSTLISGYKGSPQLDSATFDLDIDAVDNLCKQVKVKGTPELTEWYKRENKLRKVAKLIHEGKYDLPMEGLNTEMKWYQKQAVAFANAIKNSVIAYDMGLGKSMIAINYMKLINAKRVLYVCPNYLKYSFQEELEKWSDISSIVVNGTKVQKEKQIQQYIDSDIKVLIINYENLLVACTDSGKFISTNIHKYIRETYWNLIVWDEAQRLKNPESQTSRGAYALNTVDRMMLSGTPITKHPGEIWSLLHILDRQRFKTFGNFIRYYAEFVEDFRGHKVGNLTKPKQYKELLSRYMLRYLKEDVEDLPPKIFTEIKVEMYPKQRKLYEKAYKEYLKPDDEIIMTDVERFIRLNQIAVNPAILDGDNISITSDSVIDLLTDIEDRCIIGCEYIKMSALMCESIQKVHKNRKVYLINSKISVKKRHAIINEFKEDPAGIMVTTIRCLSEGVNLDCCDNIICANIAWNCGTNKQFYNRIHRMTSTRTKNYFFIIVRNSVLEYKYKKIEKERKYAEFALGDTDDTIVRRVMEDFRHE